MAGERVTEIRFAERRTLVVTLREREVSSKKVGDLVSAMEQIGYEMVSLEQKETDSDHG
jgi:hypothetical protein